MIFIEWQGLLR
jgi:hypothetical protein